MTWLKWLIVIIIRVCTVYIYYVYKYKHMHVYILRKICYVWMLNIFICNIKYNIMQIISKYIRNVCVFINI